MSTTKQWYDAHYGQAQRFSQDRRELSAWYTGMLEWLRTAHPSGPVLDLGCGTGLMLERLASEQLYSPSELHGIEQSSTALAIVTRHLPNVRVGDIEGDLPYTDASIGVVILAEVIEHLIHPWDLLERIHRILRPGGILLLSFPNYLHAPWLILRILADILDKPSWIVLQPVDRMYTTPLVKKKLRERGFRTTAIIGNIYGPPKLYVWEPGWVRRILNAAHLGGLSFHPVLVCERR